MNIGRLFRTVSHLRPKQVIYQVTYRVKKQHFSKKYAPIHLPIELITQPIPRPKCLQSTGKHFCFLNLEHEFAGWNFTDNGMLWAYNLNYFDFINQKDIRTELACFWIDQFTKELPQNYIGLDPYPIALRCLNWVKFFCQNPEQKTQTREDALYSQYNLLIQKIEYHLLGNHLLEDAFSIYAGGAYFQDKKLISIGESLLKRELQEQVLPDGAHFEQSPMYHCILLDRLLDVYNITHADWLITYAEKMLGHLESICYQDKTWPFFNDAALGIAPTPTELFHYARRLGIIWTPIPLKECGYRYLCNRNMEAFVDIGDITATYQPGHTHADLCNYELRIDGKPFIIETGISTYNKTERRQHERSTSAHNCVSIDQRDSYEVWGGFRVGRRCKASIIVDTRDEIKISHNGFPQTYSRTYRITNNSFSIEDWYDGDAISYIHFAENVDEKKIIIEGASSIETFHEKYSTEYNKFSNCKVLKIHFNGQLKCSIK